MELHRQMSPEEVKDVISGTFGCTAFTVLQSAKGGYLLRSDEELTAKIAIARRGALYLCEVTEVSFLLILFVCSYMTKFLYRRRNQVMVPLHLCLLPLHLLMLLHIALLVGSRGPR